MLGIFCIIKPRTSTKSNDIVIKKRDTIKKRINPMYHQIFFPKNSNRIDSSLIEIYNQYHTAKG
jgi:hypothetical protein